MLKLNISALNSTTKGLKRFYRLREELCLCIYETKVEVINIKQNLTTISIDSKYTGELVFYHSPNIMLCGFYWDRLKGNSYDLNNLAQSEGVIDFSWSLSNGFRITVYDVLEEHKNLYDFIALNSHKDRVTGLMFMLSLIKEPLINIDIEKDYLIVHTSLDTWVVSLSDRYWCYTSFFIEKQSNKSNTLIEVGINSYGVQQVISEVDISATQEATSPYENFFETRDLLLNNQKSVTINQDGIIKVVMTKQRVE